MDIGSLREAADVINEAIERERKSAQSGPADDPNLPGTDKDHDKDKDKDDKTAADVLIERIRVLTGGAQLGDAQAQLVRSTEHEALRIFESNIGILPLPASEKKMVDALNQTAAGKYRGEPGKGYVGIIFDPALLGEPVTAPHARINAINVTLLKVRANSSMQPPPPPPCLPPCSSPFFFMPARMVV